MIQLFQFLDIVRKRNFVSLFNSWKCEKAHPLILIKLIRLKNIKVWNLCKYSVITLYLRECLILRIQLAPLRIIEPSLNWRLFQQFVDYRTFGSKRFLSIYQRGTLLFYYHLSQATLHLCTVFCSESFGVCSALLKSLKSI